MRDSDGHHRFLAGATPQATVCESVGRYAWARLRSWERWVGHGARSASHYKRWRCLRFRGITVCRPRPQHARISELRQVHLLLYPLVCSLLACSQPAVDKPTEESVQTSLRRPQSETANPVDAGKTYSIQLEAGAALTLVYENLQERRNRPAGAV